MNRLDAYITRQFLNVLIFAVIAFCVFFVIVDLVEILDKFLDNHVPKPIIIQYYLYYLPYMIVLVMPVAVLLSVLFSLGQLSRYNELTAMQTSGLSLYRIALPLLVLGILLSVGMFYFGDYVVPETNQKKFAIKRQYLDKVPQEITQRRNNISVIQSKDERTNIAYFDPETNIAHDVTVQLYHEGLLLRRVDAKQMVWRDSSWILLNGIVREFSNGRENARPFKERPFPNFPFQLSDLKKAQKHPDEMNSRELRQFIRQIVRNGADPQKWLVDLYLKYSFPFTNFIIILFGIPLATLQRRSGTALGFGISLAICFLFFGLVKTFQAIGHNGLIKPGIAAWASNAIFGLVGVFLLLRVKK